MQVNIRWKALDEIYKMYMLLHRSDLNISAKSRQIFSTIFGKLLQKYLGLSGAKTCKSCRSRQELSNEYFLAKFGVDTEENEPYKV